MTRADVEKLLGGYAAGTLTPEERRALFEAAVADQALFDALADEEALREVLADPACRARVLSALDEPPRAAVGAFGVWLRRHSVWALAATAAAAAVLTVAVVQTRLVRQTAPAERQIAMANKPAPPPVAAPAPAQQPAQRARHAPRAFAPPAAMPASPQIPAAPLPASTGLLATRSRSAEPGTAGAIAPPPPTAAKPAASQESVTVTPRSEMIVPVETAPATPALAGRDASELKNNERSRANMVALAPRAAFDAQTQGAPAFGLHYTLLRRGTGGQDTEVPPDTLLSRGESARLRIEADQSGYLYALSGKRLLFAGPVVPAQPVLIETEPGLLHLVLLPQPDSGPLSTLVSRTRQQHGIVTDVSIASR